MHLKCTKTALLSGLVFFIWVASGCGPQPPKILLEAPEDFPKTVGGRRLFHTPNAYIYANDELDAGEADRWVVDVGQYIRRRYQRELGKGVVVVMTPEDRPLVTTLDEQLALEQDPTIMRTPPRNPKRIEEIRERFDREGIPEAVVLRGATLPLPRSKPAMLGMNLPDVPWAVAAPGEALAREVGVEMGVGVMAKRRPDVEEDRARQVFTGMAGSLAKPLLVSRGQAVFMQWAQLQEDWSDDERREAIIHNIRDTLRANLMPVPDDEDLQW